MKVICLICRNYYQESDMQSVQLHGVPDVCKECWEEIPGQERYRLTIENSRPEDGGSSFQSLCAELLRRLHKEDWFHNIVSDFDRRN